MKVKIKYVGNHQPHGEVLVDEKKAEKLLKSKDYEEIGKCSHKGNKGINKITSKKRKSDTEPAEPDDS